jgi:hypothetical protein
MSSSYSRLHEAWLRHAIHISRFIQHRDNRHPIQHSLSSSQFVQLRPHGKSSQNNDQRDVQLHDDIALVANN